MRSHILFITDESLIADSIEGALLSEFRVTVAPFEGRSIVRYLATKKDVEAILISIQGIEAGAMLSLKDAIASAIEKELPIAIIGKPEECQLFKSFYANISATYLVRPIASYKVITDKLIDLMKEDSANIKHILLVDDDGLFLRSTKLILEEHYKVSLANSANMAIKIIADERPDLVLLDYEMPEISGGQLLKALRTKHITRDLPVIFLTGVSDKTRIINILRLNVQGYLLKASGGESLLSYIHDYFAKPEK